MVERATSDEATVEVTSADFLADPRRWVERASSESVVVRDVRLVLEGGGLFKDDERDF